jgi:cytochrome oxidase Cu insertion factor (SCO1/SenC/PrrC family)/outer membrane lipoprotein-sorting protein
MLNAYRQADSYSDHATYVQQSVYRGEGIERELPFFHMSLAFDRPNRLRLSFQEAVEGSSGRKGFDIASNGSIMRSTSGELEGQVQESAAPPEITTDNLLPDPLIREVFSNRALGDVFPQLAMLLNRDDKSLVFPLDESPRLLDEKTRRERPCYRVASTSPKGQRILWIDRETYMLHRMELPIDAERATLDAENQFSQLAVWIDFEDATFDAQIDDKSFEMAVPAEARRVRRFVAPPPPAPPEELGKAVADFEFETQDGAPVTLETLAGKTVLLDFWQVDCAPCKAHTPDLDTIYRELKSDNRFAFYAVSLDGARVDAEAAEKTLRGWGGSMPLLLDPKQDAINKLKIEGTPTLMLVDAKGRLQYFHIRQHRDPKELAGLIRKVLAGDDLAAAARAEHRQLVEDYEAELDAATIKDAIVDIEVSRPDFGERRLPQKVSATELWHTGTQDVRRPGNILAVPAESDTNSLRVIVLDGGQEIVELDEKGAKVDRYAIPAAPAAEESDAESVSDSQLSGQPMANGVLRTMLDRAGKRWFAASGVGWQQVHVFDDHWKPVLAFPKDRHPGVADVQLIPHGDDGEPCLCIGYWGGIGVQGVGLDGKRAWSERSLDQVVQTVPVAKADEPNTYEFWCTSTRGTILVLDQQGKPQREITVGRHPLMHLAVADVDGAVSCCGLAVESAGRYHVLGFSSDGEVNWQHELPAGEYLYQVERIQHVMLPDGQPAWMVAAANGAIRWLSHDGELIDEFPYGQTLTGLFLTNSDDAAILLVSTPDALTAWELTSTKP